MKKTIQETDEQKSQREMVETIAINISTLAKNVSALINGPLNKKALVVLLSHSSGMYQNQVETVLNAIVNLEKDWLNK